MTIVVFEGDDEGLQTLRYVGNGAAEVGAHDVDPAHGHGRKLVGQVFQGFW